MIINYIEKENIKVEEIMMLSNTLDKDMKILQGFHSYEYVKDHLDVADGTDISYSHSEGFDFGSIENRKENSSTLGELLEIIRENNLDMEDEIFTWDSDDGNIINFKDIIITDDSIIFM